MNPLIEKDIQTIQSIEAVPHIMKMLSDATGLRFICIARVTEVKWTTCAVLDLVDFNLNPGDELDITTTFCSQVRRSTQPIVIEHAQKDAHYSKSEIPIMYGFEIQNQIKSFAELISRQIEVDERLSIAESDLFNQKTAFKLQEQFIAILGHDLRTPLSALTMGVSFLKQQVKDETSQRILARMDNSTTRMTRLISDVMDLTRGKMGNGIELNIKTVDNLEDTLIHSFRIIRITSTANDSNQYQYKGFS